MNYQLERLAKLKTLLGEPETLDQAFDFLHNALEVNSKANVMPYILGLAWSVSYREKVSNTHSCPADGVTNWGGKPDKPRGYPGYAGRVWVRIAHEHARPWISDMFAQSQFFTGTGGGGAYDGPWKTVCAKRHVRYGFKKHHTYYPDIKCYSWDFRFYHNDFPMIKDKWVHNNLLNVIKTGNETISIDQYRVWEDPATAEADANFIAECEQLRNEERNSYV